MPEPEAPAPEAATDEEQPVADAGEQQDAQDADAAADEPAT